MIAAKKTVLLTGGSGFVGRHAAAALKGAGWKVVSLSRSNPAGHGAVFADLDRPQTVLAIEDAVRAEAIVHLAAVVDFSAGADARLFAPNVLATACLAHMARRWSAPMVFASTVGVHGSDTEIIDAESALHPETAYARGKLLAEELVRGSGTAHCILRMGGIFGAEGPDHLGVNRAIALAMRGEPPVIRGNGSARRNYIYVRDVAAQIVYALDRGVSGTHLSAGSEILSIAEMLSVVSDVFTPGQTPVFAVGVESRSQVIKPSPALPPTRAWRAALEDMAEAARR